MLSETPYTYQVGGTLKVNAPSYVVREADAELYQKLQEGIFCYVLNSRQMGKSSLWIQTQERLKTIGIASAYLDLTKIIGADEEEWYEGIAYLIAKELSEYFQLDWIHWWEEKASLAPGQRLGEFIEEVLLKSIPSVIKSVVICFDEIDFVRSLPFPPDQFFALIRSCFNSRSYTPQYERLTFCFLGVATPSDLIADKQLTPFNVGEAISLKGFTLDEVEPLKIGLKDKVQDPDAAIAKILYWTGGQPFLTQRLCNLVVNQDNKTPDLSAIIQSYIIDNWDDPSQDQQEHLRTIERRILSDEQRAGILLELYRSILTQGKIANSDTREERELQLSGLVVRRKDTLEVYNLIYAEVFNESWIDEKLSKLRPYAENFRAWVNSKCKDESRLLRGKALEDANEWSRDKNLSYEDKEFLAASQQKKTEEEIQVAEKEAELDREKKARETAEKTKLILIEANREAKRRIRIGGIVLGLAVLLAAICGVWGFSEGQKAIKIKDEYEKILSFFATTDHLKELMTKLEKQDQEDSASEIGSQVEFADNIKDIKLKQVFLLASKSLAYNYLGESDKAKEAYKYSQDLKDTWFKSDNSRDVLLVSLFLNSIRASTLKEKESTYETIKKQLVVYDRYYFFPKDFHNYAVQKEIRELEKLLKNKQWREANDKTFNIIEQQSRGKNWWEFKANTESCSTLRKINHYWVAHSKGKFGFSVQREIYRSLGGTSEYNHDTWIQFGDRVGWRLKGKWLYYYEDMNGTWLYRYDVAFDQTANVGHLPLGYGGGGRRGWGQNLGVAREFFPRSFPCQL